MDSLRKLGNSVLHPTSKTPKKHARAHTGGQWRDPTLRHSRSLGSIPANLYQTYTFADPLVAAKLDPAKNGGKRHRLTHKMTPADVHVLFDVMRERPLGKILPPKYDVPKEFEGLEELPTTFMQHPSPPPSPKAKVKPVKLAPKMNLNLSKPSSDRATKPPQIQEPPLMLPLAKPAKPKQTKEKSHKKKTSIPRPSAPTLVSLTTFPVTPLPGSQSFSGFGDTDAESLLAQFPLPPSGSRYYNDAHPPPVPPKSPAYAPVHAGRSKSVAPRRPKVSAPPLGIQNVDYHDLYPELDLLPPPAPELLALAHNLGLKDSSSAVTTTRHGYTNTSPSARHYNGYAHPHNVKSPGAGLSRSASAMASSSVAGAPPRYVDRSMRAAYRGVSDGLERDASDSESEDEEAIRRPPAGTHHYYMSSTGSGTAASRLRKGSASASAGQQQRVVPPVAGHTQHAHAHATANHRSRVPSESQQQPPRHQPYNLNPTSTTGTNPYNLKENYRFPNNNNNVKSSTTSPSKTVQNAYAAEYSYVNAYTNQKVHLAHPPLAPPLHTKSYSHNPSSGHPGQRTGYYHVDIRR